MHYQIAETPEMTGPQFQAKAAQVKKLIAQRKTHQATASTRKPLFVQRHVLERELAELKAKPGSQRQASAELDRLKAENMTLKAKIAATSKPAPAKPAANMTAEQWKAQNAPPTLTRSEWQKLDGGDRAKFFRNGGKLID